MSNIDVEQDLDQVTKQLEELVGQLNALNTQREQLTQQIHNLNGIAMYLRGKQEAVPEITNGTVDIEDLERSEQYPPEVIAS
jgi:peptidoglycan hydrolase CwlO-like protein|tara:strand:- start:730 stop:975 length:246 start_codon:yes stop_codon:yes gene_type:complete